MAAAETSSSCVSSPRSLATFLHRVGRSGHSRGGTPKGRLNKLEKELVDKPWHTVRDGVEVKLLAQEQELYVLARSAQRVHKERAMRRRKLKWLWARLKELSQMGLKREALLMKLGGARAKAPAAWRLVDVDVAKEGASFSYALKRDKLRQAVDIITDWLKRHDFAETV